MGRTNLIVLYFLITFSFVPFPSFAQSDIRNIFSSTGVYEIANIANYEIIPKLKFVLPTIPDSVWIEYEKKYDSSALSQRFENIFANHFKDNDIKDYQSLTQSLMASYLDTTIPRFEYFLQKMDSVRSLIKEADTLLSKFRKDFLQNYSVKNPELINFDSLRNEVLKKLKEGQKERQNSPTDSLARFYRYFADSILNKYLQEPKSFPEIPKFPSEPFLFFDFKDFNKYFQENKEFLDYLKEQSKIWSEYLNQHGKLLKEYLDVASKYSKELLSKNFKSQKELEKKYGKKLKELENKLEKMRKEYEKKLKDLEQKQKYFEQKFKDLNLNRERNYDDSYAKLKNLLGKHYKFIDNLILVKKQIEMEILQDLQNKGFINVEVPQN